LAQVLSCSVKSLLKHFDTDDRYCEKFFLGLSACEPVLWNPLKIPVRFFIVQIIEQLVFNLPRV